MLIYVMIFWGSLRETSLQHLSSIVHWVYVIRYFFFSFRCLKQLKINITGQIMVSQFHITICIQNTYFSQTLFIDILQRGVLFKFIYIFFFNISDGTFLIFYMQREINDYILPKPVCPMVKQYPLLGLFITLLATVARPLTDCRAKIVRFSLSIVFIK
jgi:hypothetical protein